MRLGGLVHMSELFWNERLFRAVGLALLFSGAAAHLFSSVMNVILFGLLGVWISRKTYGLVRIAIVGTLAVGVIWLAVAGIGKAPMVLLGPIFLVGAGLAVLCWALLLEYGRVGAVRPLSSGGSSSHDWIPNRRFTAVRPRYTFADVAGMDELKKELLAVGKEIVAARRGTELRNGILLEGDPGNGKTFLAEALAGQLKLRFLSMTFGDVASKWVNQTTEQVIQAFDDALAQSPCLMFMDEIDSILVRRDNVLRSDAETPKTVNAVLTRLVSMRGKGVVLVAATNFVDQLDRAAIREGRFDFKIHVPPPDRAARASVFQRALSSKGLANVPPDVIERAVTRWEGFSVARVRAIAIEAAQIARAEGTREIDFALIQRALRKVQGSLGGAQREDDPTLEKLILSPEMAETLASLAARMTRIEEVERLGGSVPGGVLFYGPPGTGKTFTAKALARSAGWAFLPATGQDLLSAPERIDELLRKASDLRPCVVFIDEADDILGERGMAPWAKAATNKLLSAIDGAGGKVKDVLFVAATNHAHTMDAAALRGGRFTEKVEFLLPDEATVAEFVREWMRTTRAPLSPGLSAEVIGRTIGELSPANVKEILQAAVNHMIGRGASGEDAFVAMRDIVKAKQTVLGR